MTSDLVEFLTSGAGAAEVSTLVGQGIVQTDVLRTITRLRTRYHTDEATAIVNTALMRIRARSKFPAADLMLFDRAGLEQASAHAVARHRVDRLAPGSPNLIVDLGCGIGGDAIAMTHLAPVVGVDVDVSRLLLARHNCRVAGGPHDFRPVRSDSMAMQPFTADVVFADPARRQGDRRLRGLDTYLPPVNLLVERWRRFADVVAVKVAPGISDSEIIDGAAVEWTSLDGALREAVLSFGLAEPGERRATVLPSGVSIVGPEPEDIDVSEIGEYLHEPDDAVIRAGLVRRLAADIDASMIDPAIAYLTSSTASDHPMVSSYRIDEVLGFNLKHLKRRLGELGIGSVTIKKRGSPLTPEELRPRLRLAGDRHATLILTRTGRGPLVAISLDVG